MASKAGFAGLKAVQELRFHLCQTSKGSEGVRSFLMKSYKDLKAASPATPVLIREASGVQGTIFARFGERERPARQQRLLLKMRNPARRSAVGCM